MLLEAPGVDFLATEVIAV